jgi:hypothetical protein
MRKTAKPRRARRRTGKAFEAEAPSATHGIPAGKHEEMRQGREGAKNAKLKNFLTWRSLPLRGLGALHFLFFALFAALRFFDPSNGVPETSNAGRPMGIECVNQGEGALHV